MNVLMTTDAVGGVWTYALELSRALHAFDVSVTLVALGPAPSAEQRAQAQRLPNVRLHVRPGTLEWMEDPWEHLHTEGEWLLELEKRTRPDVIHLNQYVHGRLQWNAPVLMAAHSCVCSWWRAVHGKPAPPAWDRYRHEAARAMRGARLLIAPTSAMLVALNREHDLSGIPQGVIPNGARSRARLRSAPGKAPLVLSVGRFWDPAKNLAALDGAAAQASWPVWVAGDSTPPEGNATTLDPRHVRLLGKVPETHLNALYSSAAVFALPARYEPFGLAPLEAARAGCALVLGDIPSLREVWGDAAVFVDPGAPTALGDALTHLAESASLRAAYAARAFQRAQAYTPERMASMYASAYERLRDEHTGGTPVNTDAEEERACAS